MRYSYQPDGTWPLSEQQVQETFASVMQHVYLWMCLGLFVTAGVAALFYGPFLPLLIALLATRWLFFGLLIAELGLVWWLGARMSRLSVSAARSLFIVYAALNGVTLSCIFLVYTLSSIAATFVATASLFGAMGIIGYTTKRDLSSWGSYLLMGLVGLIIASLVNIFLASSGLDWLLTYAGIVLFLALTIYDTQRIKRQMMSALGAGDKDVVSRVGMLGALSLYLDFVNLFLRLLRIMGRRGRR